MLKSFLLSLLMMFSFISNIHAYTILTSVPQDYENNAAPKGYIQLKCYVTKTGSYKNIWSGGHQICEYYKPKEEMWVAGYWACQRYTPSNAICHSWRWIPAHWASKNDIQLEPDFAYR